MILFFFLLGLIVGSFVNVVILRLPMGENLGGRSRCVGCLRKIAWYDLIPLISFLVLRGKCRQCGKGIKLQYPLVEFYSGIVFAGSFVAFSNFGWVQVLFSIFLLESFLILAVIDFRHLILPDVIVGLLAVVALLFLFFRKYADIGSLNALTGDSLFNSLFAALVFFLIFFFPWLISGGRWLGLGDAKLAGAIGLTFGFFGGMAILYMAIIAGALAGLVLWLAKRAKLKTKLPLGTFICAAASFYIFAGPWVNQIANKWLWTMFPTLFI